MSRHTHPIVAMLLLALILTAGARAQTPSIQTLYTTNHPAMGTTYTLYLYSSNAASAATVSEEVFDEIDRIEQLLSNYRDSSELSRINQNAAAAPVTTDPEMLSFLEASEHWSRVSDGAFDITVGALMKAWGFFRHEGRIPTSDELDRLRAVTGWQKVILDPSHRTVSFTATGIELDPGGIGKGFAVDAAVRILRADGVSAALLSAGSSTLYALGAPPHQPGWRIVIPGPLPSQATLSTVILRDTSLSSSDCSQKNFTLADHLYCHIMDPQTMRPVEGRIQVSIVNPSATASDALSNVLFVQPPAQAIQTLANYAPGSRAIIVSADPTRCAAFRWQARIACNPRPSKLKPSTLYKPPAAAPSPIVHPR
jgi:thiamine biosynthesis lipoprotein